MAIMRADHSGQHEKNKEFLLNIGIIGFQNGNGKHADSSAENIFNGLIRRDIAVIEDKPEWLSIVFL